MAKLVIVESPAKAKTIAKYLGGGYRVKASMGHLRDLPKKKMGVDLENGFIPQYEPIDGKDKTISELRDAVSESDYVYLATDPDREGEAISWHLKELLNLPDDGKRRVTFNEITKKAVTEGISHPRDIDENLVDAQQARRILDRIVGYKLSPFLWRKVRRGLSAGRVQSVVTRLVVDREREIQAFVPEEYWTIDVTLAAARQNLVAKFYGDENGKLELKTEEETNAVLQKIEGAEYITKSIKKSLKKKAPPPPFITSTLQQEASRRLNMTSRRTMSVAQELYEGVELEGHGLTGLITYMRTDSLRLADDAVADARQFIEGAFGAEYALKSPRVFKTKKGAQDAHEAVRPSDASITPDSIKKDLTNDQYKLYKLIWSRFIACQMADAVYDTMSIDIACAGYIFRTTGYKVKFAGFTAVYEESTDDEREGESKLPELTEGQELKHKKTEPKQHFTQPPARYTEASLIRAMEEKGIGRPSTYAPTITTVLSRDYVEKEGKSLKPTPLGEAVTDLMKDKFSDIIDVKFTAKMEDELDEVESGKTDYREILDHFYKDFSGDLERAEKDLDQKRIKVKDEETDVVCELCGRNMVIKSGRFGKFLACPGYPECKNTKPLAEDTGAVCPLCGGKVLKKKSKKGFAYYGCEKNPTCTFMTWDKPTKEVCPQCGGTVYRRYNKLEKKNVCLKPDCGWEQPLAASTKTKKEAAPDAGSADAAAQADGAGEKTAKKAAEKKSTAKKPAAKKTAGKKSTAKKAAAADEAEQPARKRTRKKTEVTE